MSTDALPEENFVSCAILLAAADFALCDDMRPERALAHALRSWEVRDSDPLWAGGGHCGDCTSQPHTCTRCFCDGYEAEARGRWEA